MDKHIKSKKLTKQEKKDKAYRSLLEKIDINLNLEEIATQNKVTADIPVNS